MRISNLIKRLEHIRDGIGDVNVYVPVGDDMTLAEAEIIDTDKGKIVLING